MPTRDTHNTEDKDWWVIHGANKEQTFANRVAPRIGLDVKINPDKKTDPFAHDIFVAGNIADLKCQNTPFFKAEELYGIDPKYAVTFNQKDLERYKEQYPQIEIYFWVDWQKPSMVIRGEKFTVDKLAGVWKTTNKEIGEIIKKKKIPVHWYHRRRFDQQDNAKGSYLLDLRWFKCIWIKK